MAQVDQAMYIIDIVRIISCILLPRTLRVFEPHSHHAYELHYVVAGRGSFELRGATLTVRPGDLFYTCPGTVHRMSVPEGEYLLQYVAFMELGGAQDQELAEDLQALIGEGSIRRIGDRYHALFAQISGQTLSTDARQRRAASARMYGFLYEMMTDAPMAKTSHPAIDRALELMRSRLGEAYDLDQLSEELGLDKSYFVRLFKKNIGVPPMKYATHLKMSAASDLLRTTSLPLAAIAARIGFRDEYHFAKRFKRWSGTAPGAYRRQG